MRAHQFNLEKIEFLKLITGSIRENLDGLPSLCRLVIYELLEYCDYSTGIITLPTLDEIVRKNFYVEPLRGQKKEDITTDTICNALRLIKKSKPRQFVFTIQNKRILISMPFLSQFQGLLSETEEVATVSYQTKNKPTNKSHLVSEKKEIDDDFYPNQLTISHALAKGYVSVTDVEEISAFIKHNKNNKTKWTDFNIVYLRWLEHKADHYIKASKQNRSARVSEQDAKATGTKRI